MDQDRVAKILDDLQNNGQRLHKNSGDEELRASLLESATKLAVALQSPEEVIQGLLEKDILTRACILTAMDAGLFGHLSKSASVSSEEVSEITGVSPSLTDRLFRHLAGHGLVVEDGANRYLGNEITLHLAKEAVHDSFKFWFKVMVPVYTRLPSYFAQSGYKEPNDTMETAFQFAHETDLPFFAWLKADAEADCWFANTMAAQVDSRRANWSNSKFYPVKDCGIEAADVTNVESMAILVDVGGGLGLDAKRFVEAWPEIKGRIILQERQEVLDVARDLPPRIEKLSYSFFDEQPVKGARLYYFHRVLHDHPDSKCREILLSLKPAMKPGYSRLLIHDFLVPSKDAPTTATLSDLMMMVLFAAKERKEEDFRRLVESVGFKVTAVWRSTSPSGESVMEAVLPER